MNRDAFAESRQLCGLSADGLERLDIHVPALPPTWEKPVFWRGPLRPAVMARAPPDAQDSQQPRREQGIAVLLAFPLADAKEHALGIDIAYLQAHHFGDTQSGSVSGHQGSAVAQ